MRDEQSKKNTGGGASFQNQPGYEWFVQHIDW